MIVPLALHKLLLPYYPYISQLFTVRLNRSDFGSHR